MLAAVHPAHEGNCAIFELPPVAPAHSKNKVQHSAESIMSGQKTCSRNCQLTGSALRVILRVGAAPRASLVAGSFPSCDLSFEMLGGPFNASCSIESGKVSTTL